MVCYEMDLDLNNIILWNGHVFDQKYTMKWLRVWTMVYMYYVMEMDLYNDVLWNDHAEFKNCIL